MEQATHHHDNKIWMKYNPSLHYHLSPVAVLLLFHIVEMLTMVVLLDIFSASHNTEHMVMFSVATVLPLTTAL